MFGLFMRQKLFLRVARTFRVLGSASRGNDLFFNFYE
jgi:hypothetical protein